MEYDVNHNCFRLDRMLPQAMPANYGFIPQTLCEDGDALDVLVLGDDVLTTGTVLTVRLVGMLHMIDNGVTDNKVLAIPDYLEPSDIQMNIPSGRSPRNLYGAIINFFGSYKGEGATQVADQIDTATSAIIEFERAMIRHWSRGGTV